MIQQFYMRKDSYFYQKHYYAYSVKQPISPYQKVRSVFSSGNLAKIAVLIYFIGKIGTPGCRRFSARCTKNTAFSIETFHDKRNEIYLIKAIRQIKSLTISNKVSSVHQRLTDLIRRV